MLISLFFLRMYQFENKSVNIECFLYVFIWLENCIIIPYLKNMMKNNRLNRENSILFICDVQEKFLPHVYKPDAVVEAA